MADINAMRQVAEQITNEAVVGGNTATRVGGLFSDVVDALAENIENTERVDNQLNGNIVTQFENAGTASSYWKDNNGVVSYGASGMGLHRADYVDVVSGTHIEIETNLGSASVAAAYFCDDNGNIIISVPKNYNTPTTIYSGDVPSNATRVYINYLSAYTLELAGDLSIIREEIDELSQEIDDVPVMRQMINDLYNANVRTLEIHTAQRRWENVNGKVVLNSTNVSVSAYKPITIGAHTPYTLIASVAGTSAVNYFVTDADDNILASGTDTSDEPTFTGYTPANSAKIYINSVVRGSAPSLTTGMSVFEEIAELNGKAKTRVIVLSGIFVARSSANSISQEDGNIVYLTDEKKFLKVLTNSPRTYEEITPSNDVVWLYAGRIYTWNGTTLNTLITESVIYLKAFATGAPSGMSKDDYYFNTNLNAIYRNNGSTYNSTPVPFRYDTIYIYNNEFYLYNGTTLYKPMDTAINAYQENYGARVIVDNAEPMSLTEEDFVLGNLSATGEEISANNVIRSGYIGVVPSASFSFTTSNSYRCDLYEFDENKTFKKHYGWKTGTYSGTLRDDTTYIRIIVASPSGTSTAPVWANIALSVTIGKVYQAARAAAESAVKQMVDDGMSSYYDMELPILAPSPQLPANDATDSDFNAETVTSTDIHTVLSSLIDSLSAPDFGSTIYPKVLTRYEVSGMDASGVYPIYTYALCRRNRYAWRNADELYAWKDGSDNIVYIDTCSPHVGDVIYSSASRATSGKTIASYNAATGTMVDSSSTSYTREESANVPAVMFWTEKAIQRSSASGAAYQAYDKNDTLLGNATFVDTTHLSFGGKTYTRSECFDYHTDHKGTIFVWGNEHGPTSDPLEPSIVLYRLAKDMVGGCRNNPFVEFLKQYFKIVFIPCANPWGCQYPRVYGRQNSAGVNINRNYDTPGWSVQESTEKGSYAGDQAETQYIMNMCKRFTPDISIDIHCLGFGNQVAEGLMYLSETAIPNQTIYQRTKDTLLGMGYLFDHRGDPEPLQMAHGSEWMDYYGMVGGVFEMNAGAYSNNHVYNGKQHTPSVMEACYTELLNCIRGWMQVVLPDLDLSKMSLR